VFLRCQLFCGIIFGEIFAGAARVRRARRRRERDRSPRVVARSRQTAENKGPARIACTRCARDIAARVGARRPGSVAAASSRRRRRRPRAKGRFGKSARIFFRRAMRREGDEAAAGEKKPAS
jgi:hypothetical protein